LGLSHAECYRACLSKCIQSSTTIITALEELSPIINEKKECLLQKEKIARSNSAIIEQYFDNNNVLIVSIKNEIHKEFITQQKQRDIEILKKIKKDKKEYGHNG
jgi:hypothetical protein